MKNNVLKQSIFIKQLELNVFVGLYEHEKKSPQRLLIDAEVWLAPQKPESDGFSDIVCYVKLKREIELYFNKHVGTLEKIAYDLCDICLTHPSTTKVSLTLTKPDIINDVEGVGVTLVQEKN